MSKELTVWSVVFAALVCVYGALHTLGPEPALEASDYKQMQCQYMPDAPECRTKLTRIATN